MRVLACTVLSCLASLVQSVSITDIQGPAFQSPLLGETVHDVQGIVTAKTKYGFWMSGEPSPDDRVSNGLSVFTRSHAVLDTIQVGDNISLSGKVSEYRARWSPNDLYLTQLTSPSRVVVHSSGNSVKPVVLGVDRSPPTQHLSALDEGPDGYLSVPNNQTLLEHANATLQPDRYGLDFWESLEGQVVSVRNPVAINFPTRFHEFWVYGDWSVTGKNERGGLTMTFGPDGYPDANPEAIIIGTPVDGSRNPSVAIATTLEDIVGIVTFRYGFYSVLPLTSPTVKSIQDYTVTPTSLSSSDDPCVLTIGDYNVENLSPRSHHLKSVADHIVNYLNAPDIMFLQEIVDDSGSKDDGTISANKTLKTLVNAISKTGEGPVYDFFDISPVNNEDGGKPGSNIRQAYLYRPSKVALVPGSPVGGSGDATEPTLDAKGGLTLSYNPGRIEPRSPAWEEARKPLAAAWQTTTGERFYTVNVHLSSKRGSSSSHGDARTPINGRAELRRSQVNTTANFVNSILAHDLNASVVVVGDCNDYLHTRSVFDPLTAILHDVDEASGIDPVERYTYVYDQNTEKIDHIFVSDAIKDRGTEVEHVHVNLWAKSLSERVSDHDPSVARVRVCDALSAAPATPTTLQTVLSVMEGSTVYQVIRQVMRLVIPSY